MLVTFVKLSEGSCLSRARRADGALVERTVPPWGPVPHDLQHLLIEEALGIGDGLWGRLEQGHDMATQCTRRTKPGTWRDVVGDKTPDWVGWEEDLVASVIEEYQFLRESGWVPAAPADGQPQGLAATLPIAVAPSMTPWLGSHQRPPVDAVIDAGSVMTACLSLYAADVEWAEQPVGGSIERTWVTPHGRASEGLIYHLALLSEWQAAVDGGEDYRGSTLGKSLSEEGFIHCSFASQVQTVADLVYRGRADVVVLSIDASRLNSPVRTENLSGGDDVFPHIYGPLTLDAVVAASLVPVREDGRLDLRTDGQQPGVA